MGKITKHTDFMEKLHGLVIKEATAGTATGKPGADTHYTSVSKETDHIDKNKEGHPEHNPQEFKQEKAKDPSDPTKTHHKSAEELESDAQFAVAAKEAAEKETNTKKPMINMPSTGVPETAKEEAHTKTEQKVAEAGNTNEKLAQLGQQLLNTINEMNKQATAGTATGKPGADTHYTSVSKETDHIDKNKEGHPEHNPQEFKQEKAKDPSDPTKTHHKSAEELELDKEASFELGRQFARAFLSKSAADSGVYKEAGRRDFETLIATAAAELEQEQAKVTTPNTVKQANAPVQAEDEDYQVKQAEDAGAAAFYQILKQAQEEERANQIKVAFEQKINAILLDKQATEKQAAALAAKVAQYETVIEKQAEEAKLDAKFAQWGSRVVDEVINRLKIEPTK